jgi:TorA maturation chaperone TorD
MAADVNAWLERAASWRLASLLFQEPRENRAAELSALAALVSEPVRAGAEALVAETALRAEDYQRVLGPGGCAAAESSYDRAAIANRGPLIADVSAFYEAFAYPPRHTSDLVPDHIVVELDFLGFLALKIAFAMHEGRAEECAVARTAYDEFLERHTGFWIDALLAGLTAGGHAPFASAARWVTALLERERVPR